jgi:UDP-N-acetylmuramate--alanine ligase
VSEFDLVELAKGGPVHFVGIGGAGMAPLAEMLLLAGGRVTGCDSQFNEGARLLVERGAEFRLGHDPAHV